MFRRRPLRPLGRRPLRRPGPPLARAVPPRPRLLPPKIRKALNRANRLAAEGKHAEAAAIFEHLSAKANQHGMPVRAAELALQASRSYFAVDAIEQALPLARQGLLALIRSGHTRRVPTLLAKATTALRSKGHDAEADQLEEEVTRALEGQGLSLAEMQQAPTMTGKRGSLPAQCGGCGAPLAPGDVEWHDEHTAECPYCGTLAKAT